MSKTVLRVLALFAVLAAGPAPVWGQEPAPSPEDLTLRPGDTITWTPGSGHGLQFGDVPDVAPFSAVQAILDLNPPLTADPPGVGKGGRGNVVRATVKATAAVGGKFNFTCSEHNDMITVPFTIAAPAPGQPRRDVQIVTTGLRWILRVDKKLGPP